VNRLDGPGILRARASEVAVETPGIPYQLDGDPIGVTPVRFTIRKGALRVRVPSGPLPQFLQPAD
jgi:diacylglycerol kinase family enzyme